MLLLLGCREGLRSEMRHWWDNAKQTIDISWIFDTTNIVLLLVVLELEIQSYYYYYYDDDDSSNFYYTTHRQLHFNLDENHTNTIRPKIIIIHIRRRILMIIVSTMTRRWSSRACRNSTKWSRSRRGRSSRIGASWICKNIIIADGRNRILP